MLEYVSNSSDEIYAFHIFAPRKKEVVELKATKLQIPQKHTDISFWYSHSLFFATKACRSKVLFNDEKNRKIFFTPCLM